MRQQLNHTQTVAKTHKNRAAALTQTNKALNTRIVQLSKLKRQTESALSQVEKKNKTLECNVTKLKNQIQTNASPENLSKLNYRKRKVQELNQEMTDKRKELRRSRFVSRTLAIQEIEFVFVFICTTVQNSREPTRLYEQQKKK